MWRDQPGRWPAVAAGVLVAVLLTAYGHWYVWRRKRTPGDAFLFFQALGDIGIITLLVHFARGSDSVYPSLYILIIAAYALLMSSAGACWWRLTIAAVYFADSMLLGAPSPGWRSGARSASSSPRTAGRGPCLPASRRRRRAPDPGDRAAPGAARGRRDPAQHPFRRHHGGRHRPARLHQSDGRAAAADRRRADHWACRSSTSSSCARRSCGPRMVAAHPARPEGEPRGGNGRARGRPDLSDRSLHHHLRAGFRRPPVGHGDLHRHLGPQAAQGAPSPRRAAGGGGRAFGLAGARDPEPAGVDPQLGRAAGPVGARRRGRSLLAAADRARERPAEPAAVRVPRLRPGPRHRVRPGGPAGGGRRPRPGWCGSIPTAARDIEIRVQGARTVLDGRRGPAAPGGRQPDAQRGAGRPRAGPS